MEAAGILGLPASTHLWDGKGKMSKRKFKTQEPVRASYRRQGSEEGCDHALEPHVVYDLKASGYRAQLRCRCTTVKIDGKKVRDTCQRAEEDSKVMMHVAEVHVASRFQKELAT
jgi:hypothetical protein